MNQHTLVLKKIQMQSSNKSKFLKKKHIRLVFIANDDESSSILVGNAANTTS